MLSTLGSHARHNLVAYLALFVALGGTAVAAKPMFTGADIQDGSLTDADIAAANKDGAAATPSLRTLGTGAHQAMPGNATPSSSPTGSAGGDLAGSYPNPTIADGAIGTPQFSSTIPAVGVLDRYSSYVDPCRFLPWTEEFYDTAGLHSTTTDPSFLIAPVAGIYSVSGNVEWDANPSGKRQLWVARNGGLISSVPNAVLPNAPANPDYGPTQAISTDVKLTAGDHIELLACQDSPNILSVRSQITMSWVAPG